MRTGFKIRAATAADIPVLQTLIERSGVKLSAGFYTLEQAQAVTREVFGVDTQLIRDGTCFAIEDDACIVACGGWSKRSTPYGGDKHGTPGSWFDAHAALHRASTGGRFHFTRTDGDHAGRAAVHGTWFRALARPEPVARGRTGDGAAYTDAQGDRITSKPYALEYQKSRYGPWR
jgi:hypothetical protein